MATGSRGWLGYWLASRTAESAHWRNTCAVSNRPYGRGRSRWVLSCRGRSRAAEAITDTASDLGCRHIA
jgi:hypothetical protein